MIVKLLAAVVLSFSLTAYAQEGSDMGMGAEDAPAPPEVQSETKTGEAVPTPAPTEKKEAKKEMKKDKKAKHAKKAKAHKKLHAKKHNKKSKKY